MTKRDHAIRALRAEGKTLQEIGDAFGITRARVQQIVADMPLPAGRKYTKKRLQPHAPAQPEAGEAA